MRTMRRLCRGGDATFNAVRPIRTKEQQAVLMLHRTRQLLLRRIRTMMAMPCVVGHRSSNRASYSRVGTERRSCSGSSGIAVSPAVYDISRGYSWRRGGDADGTEIASLTNIMALHRACEASRRLAEIRASAQSAPPRWSRDPRLNASGQDVVLRPGCRSDAAPAARRGSAASPNRAIDTCGGFVVGAMAVIRYARKHGTGRRPWLRPLMEPAGRRKWRPSRSPTRLSRMAWAIMVRDESTKSRNCCWLHEVSRQLDW